jgi:hypothetical protein
MCEASCTDHTSAQENTLKALAGLIALVIVLMGSTMLTKTPGAARMVLSVQITDDQADGVPPYMHFDRDEWR